MTKTASATNHHFKTHRSAPGFLATIIRWGQLHRQRRDLADLDATALNDIGISRDDARKEARKPFWMMANYH